MKDPTNKSKLGYFLYDHYIGVFIILTVINIIVVNITKSGTSTAIYVITVLCYFYWMQYYEKNE